MSIGRERWIEAIYDLKNGLMQWRLWRELAFRDLRRTYYGSFFGQFWVTLSLGIFVASVGAVYAIVFSQDIKEYLPFLCSGLISWRLITSFITEGGAIYLGSGGFIQGFNLPLSLFSLKSLLKNTLTFFHWLTVFVVVALVFSSPVNWNTLLLFPGLAVVLLNGFWVVTLIGIVCTRFRDFTHVVSNSTVLMFFVTPVFWPPEMITRYHAIITFNPLYHVLELLRAPLLGKPPSPENWLVGLGMALVGMAIVFPIFARFRTRLVFWI